MKYYVGLDVHSKSSTFEVQDESGRITGRGEVPTALAGLLELKRRNTLPAGTQVALETGTTSFFVARHLAAMRLVPVVIDAREVRVKASRPKQKSDQRDAHELCEGIRRGIYHTIVHIPTPEISAIRETLSRRRHFVRAKTREVNAAKRLLRSAGYSKLCRSLSRDLGWTRLIEELVEEPQLVAFVRQHRAAWRCADEQVSALDELLTVQLKPYREQIKLLTTMPGVGRIVAATVLAVLSDVSRFPGAKQVASYGGLVPSTYQSGQREAHGHITKQGSSELRAMLCEAAHHAKRQQHPLNPYFSQICVKRGYKAAIVAVAHRMLRILYAMLRTGRPFDVQQLNVEKGPFTKEVKRAYRLRQPRREAQMAG